MRVRGLLWRDGSKGLVRLQMVIVASVYLIVELGGAISQIRFRRPKQIWSGTVHKVPEWYVVRIADELEIVEDLVFKVFWELVRSSG